MKRVLGFTILTLVVGCGRGDQQGSLDTSMVVVELPPPSAADSAKAPSKDSVLATLNAYHSKRISADAAAPILVDYGQVGGTLNVEVDPELQAAIRREFIRRMKSQ